MIEIIKNLLSGLGRHPTLGKKFLSTKKRIYKKICDLDVGCIKSAEPIPYSALENYLPDKIKKGEVWASEKFGCCWLLIKGKVPPSCKHPVIVLNVNGEGLAYHKGEPFDIVTTIMGVADAFQAPGAGKRILDLNGKLEEDGSFEIWVDCGYNGINGMFLQKAKLCYCYLADKNQLLSNFYYKALSLGLVLVAEEKKGLPLQEEIVDTLDKALTLAKKNIHDAISLLNPFWSERKLANWLWDKHNTNYTLIGHAHLDLAWLWPKRESMRKAERTFTNALSILDKFPDYRFGASQAQMFDWIRVNNPPLFKKLQDAVDDGKIEIQGGMWVESDTNIPCGESLIRQFAYGDEFFLKYFGKTSKTVWLPDAFGYTQTLPQIIKGVGKENFATIKLSWNKVNSFPYQSFVWKGLDGSEVLTHISSEGTYCNDGSPLSLAKSKKRKKQDTKQDLIIYGDGDGGGGPGEGHLGVITEMRGLYKEDTVNCDFAENFFNKLKEEENLPDYTGELYLETHQGTYTSQSNTKKYHRLIENALHILEWLYAVEGKEEKCDEHWKTLLFNEFHDVIPGSSIQRVHQESVSELLETYHHILDKISAICHKKEELSDTAINPSPFAQTGYKMVEGQPCIAKCKPYSTAKYTPFTPSPVIVEDNLLENAFLRVKFGKNGKIISLWDKKRNRELASEKGLNLLTIYNDPKSHYDAWDINPDYIKRPHTPKLVKKRVYTQDFCGVIELVYKYNNSGIMQKIKLGQDGKLLFKTVVEWKESHKMLRANFYPTCFGDEALCDIQFGEIKRSTKTDNPVDKAKFEICAHKYLATQDDKGIFALYTDYKYGYRAKDGLLSINLLRSPKYPDPNCDMGIHEFHYAIDLPSDEKELVKNAYNFNYRIFNSARDINFVLPFSLNNEDIILETVKPSQFRKGITLRLYERFGKKTTCKLDINAEYKTVYQTNLLEKEEKSSGLDLEFSPREIKTIVIEF